MAGAGIGCRLPETVAWSIEMKLKLIVIALAGLQLVPVTIVAGQQPVAAANGSVFVAYYWRAKPGQLAAYSEYIRTVAEPIDEDARRSGVFEDVRTVVPAA